MEKYYKLNYFKNLIKQHRRESSQTSRESRVGEVDIFELLESQRRQNGAAFDELENDSKLNKRLDVHVQEALLEHECFRILVDPSSVAQIVCHEIGARFRRAENRREGACRRRKSTRRLEKNVRRKSRSRLGVIRRKQRRF